MKALFLLLVPLLGGCTITRELTSGRVAIVHHLRGTGAELKIPNQTGDSFLVFRFGWFSETTTVIPCSTNGPIYAAPLSDTFKLGQNVSFSGDGTTITEDLQTFAPGATPPTPRISLKSEGRNPKAEGRPKPETRNPKAEAE